VGIGGVLGWFLHGEKLFHAVDKITNGALMLLMTVIGLSIGINDTVIRNLGTIGRQSMLLALSAIAFSVLFVVFMEKTCLPLADIRKRVEEEAIPGDNPWREDWEKTDGSTSSGSDKRILYLIGICVVLGLVLGVLLTAMFPHGLQEYLVTFTVILLYLSLVLLYTGVGFTIGGNKRVLLYMKVLGFRVVLLSLGILLGSVSSGLIWGYLLPIPLSTSLMASSGMSYYSLTGAFMTQVFGIEAGTYGFMVNVMREFFTVLLLPLLIRISPGSAIASGAAGNMDTMLGHVNYRGYINHSGAFFAPATGAVFPLITGEFTRNPVFSNGPIGYIMK
jgi:uncharacterized membrane protein YbjE (DUF340 family)